MTVQVKSYRGLSPFGDNPETSSNLNRMKSFLHGDLSFSQSGKYKPQIFASATIGSHEIYAFRLIQLKFTSNSEGKKT